MSVQNWSDYHAWPVTSETMHAARLELTFDAYLALIGGSKPSEGGYLTVRVSIEDAALAMPPIAAAQFLVTVYQLDDIDTGIKLLAAIQMVRA